MVDSGSEKTGKKLSGILARTACLLIGHSKGRAGDLPCVLRGSRCQGREAKRLRGLRANRLGRVGGFMMSIV